MSFEKNQLVRFESNGSLFDKALFEVPELSILKGFKDGSWMICGGFALHLLYGTEYSDVDVFFIPTGNAKEILKENDFTVNDQAYQCGYGITYNKYPDGIVSTLAFSKLQFIEVPENKDLSFEDTLVKRIQQFDLKICMRAFNNHVVYEPATEINFTHNVKDEKRVESSRKRFTKYQHRVSGIEGRMGWLLQQELDSDEKCYMTYW